MGGIVSLLPYVGIDEIRGKVVEVAKCLTAEFLGTMFLVLVKNTHFIHKNLAC